MNISRLSEVLAEQPKYRYQQINKALFQDFVSSWEEISSLPKNLRQELTDACPLEIKAEIIPSQHSASLKALISFEDGESVETVIIRQRGSKDGGSPRNTVCISSQVGCPLGCAFCATGQAGFSRNLSAEEIVEQVLFWSRFLKKEGGGEKVDNVVFMGMGEPFLNYEQFIKSVKFLNDKETFNLGSRRISVSTAGIPEGIKRLAGESLQINLAVSLHAPEDALRQDLMPIAKKHQLREILKEVDRYISKTGRRVMFEYLMLKEINDSDEQADRLAKLVAKPLYLLNLIPYNQTGRFQASSRERIEKFKKRLENSGVKVTTRLSFGGDIEAACGQLRASRQKRK
jgi:23S rRNA (adenine2503-C2)-methyltransferase